MRELVSIKKFDNSKIREKNKIPNERIRELESTKKFDNSKIREKKSKSRISELENW